MPSTLASASKRDWRRAVADLLNDNWQGAFTTVSSTTVLLDTALNGYGENWFAEWYTLITDTDASATGQYRINESFSGSTLTLRTALSATTNLSTDGTGTYELHKYNPRWYTLAANMAAEKLFPFVYRPVTGFLVQPQNTPALRSTFGLPRNMRRAFKVQLAGLLRLNDPFTRADSSTEAGNGWTAASGDTFGISSNRLYSVSDTDGDLLTQDFTVKDLLLQSIVRGTLASGSSYRSPGLVLRWLDSSNYLVVRLLNGAVDLRKVDAGSESSLSTGTVTTADATDYVLTVGARGSRLRIWVDGVELIDYELAGLNLKYTEGTTHGMRLDKASTPASAARWDDFYCFECSMGPTDLGGWRQDELSQTIAFDGYLSPAYLVQVDGGAVLTALAEDTNRGDNGTLASDTTATLEIATTDPGWALFKHQGALEVLRMAAKDARSAEAKALCEQDAADMAQRVERMLISAGQPRGKRLLKVP